MPALSRREFLLRAGIGLGASAGLAGRRASAASRPNIVFILADDMGWAELGCYGNALNETPNIDRLAAQGMRFTDAYVQPVCSPTRASLMTGQAPARIGITNYIQWDGDIDDEGFHANVSGVANRMFLPLDYTTLPERLGEAGYLCALVGKWHLGQHDPHRAGSQGFEVVRLSSELPGGYFYPWKAIPAEGEEGEYLTDRLNAEAVDFINSQAEADRPFFLFLSHYAPHTPLVGKPELVEKHRRKAPGAGENAWKMAAMLESVDEGVGMVLDALDAGGSAENTLVVFLSDNGGETRVTTNAPLRGGKSTLYEGGIRVPMIVRWPGITEPGVVSSVPVVGSDLFPTFLEAAGAPVPRERLEGCSLVPVLQGRSLPERPLFWHFPHSHFLGGVPSGAVRLGDLKLIEFYDDDRVELYDLSEDIGESRDLSAGQPGDTRRLREMLAKWRESVGAKMPLPRRGLQLHLTFDDPPEAAVVLDRSPHGRRLDIHGTMIVPGRVGLARAFNGRDDYLELPRPMAPDPTGLAVTVRARVRPQSGDGVIVAQGGNGRGYSLYLVDGRPAFCATVDFERQAVIAQKPLPWGWSELVGTLSAEGVVRLFVNGEQVAEAPAPRLIESMPGDTLQVGADTIQPVGDYIADNSYHGLIDELWVEFAEYEA